MTESVTMMMLPRFLEYIGRGRPPKAKFMGRGPYGIFETKDGKYISLGVVEDHFWYNLCGALGFDDLAADPALGCWHGRNTERLKIVPRLKAAIKEKDRDYWLKTLAEADVTVAPVEDMDSWMHHPQFIH